MLTSPLNHVKNQDPDIYKNIIAEAERQKNEIELIASENYISPAVLETMGTILNNKYSEGYAGKRYYAGNQIIDNIETLAVNRAKQLFDAEHANVQPLSGSPANAAVYMAFLKPGDKVLGLSLDHGGHLSHGHPINFSGILYDFVSYKVEKDTGKIDMDKVREIALREKPKMIVAGFSAYSRNMEWQRFKDIADEVGAYTFADIAHVAGLIAAKLIDNPVPFFDVVSTTTHKTLRGPRGAIILCKEKYAKNVDRAVFPGMQGGPHDHINAAKAVAFKEALQPAFKDYAAQIIKNAKVMGEELIMHGFKIISDGTDNHLLLIDMNSKNTTGKIAEQALEDAGISCNKNMIPDDPRTPFDPSGIRIGTPAVTTRGMKEEEMKIIAKWMNDIIENPDDEELKARIKQEVHELCQKFPVPGID